LSRGRLVLESASAEDVPALAALERECFSNSWTEAQLRAETDGAPGRLTLVLRQAADRSSPGRGIVAYCMLRVVADEVHVNNLAVAPAQRRHGLGRRLLRLGLGVAAERGALSAHLEVRQSNLAAIRLYRTLGFATAGLRRDYYSNPTEDALRLECCDLQVPLALRDGLP
jgi:[ribosomal protein S18]-alanine N-acetyltransferase